MQHMKRSRPARRRPCPLAGARRRRRPPPRADDPASSGGRAGASVRAAGNTLQAVCDHLQAAGHVSRTRPAVRAEHRCEDVAAASTLPSTKFASAGRGGGSPSYAATHPEAFDRVELLSTPSGLAAALGERRMGGRHPPIRCCLAAKIPHHAGAARRGSRRSQSRRGRAASARAMAQGGAKAEMMTYPPLEQRATFFAWTNAE